MTSTISRLTSRSRLICRALGIYVVILGILLTWLFPVLWVVITSFKDRKDIFTLPPTLVFQPILDNYYIALIIQSIAPSLRDSLIIASISTFVALLAAVPAGYAYARLNFRFKRQLAFSILLLQMTPLLGLIIPYFLVFTWLKWLDTYHAIILVDLGAMIPTSTWLMITYFQDLPREMEEAAMVDGANRWQTFGLVMLPQAAGGVGVAAVLSFLWAWNEFLFAVVLTGTRVRPITVGMLSFLQFQETLWGPLMATAVMAMLPAVALALLAQRHITRGLTLGAVK